jgi:predicted glycosyltransferase
VRQVPRILLYSHDTLGLGHLRRTLLICSGLGAQFEACSILVVTGSPIAHGFRMPPGVDYVKLPSVTKLENERYDSRSLNVCFRDILRLREQIILQTVFNYAPDFVFVDNVPLGMKGEMRVTLEYLKARRPETCIFLNLRDVLDDRAEIIPLWSRLGVYEALERYYDGIFIYGLPLVFDPVSEYQWPESIRSKACFCGYIPRAVDRDASCRVRQSLCGDGERLVLVTVGGGSDGDHLIENYLRALPRLPAADEIASVVLLGPEMAPCRARDLESAASMVPRVTVMEFCDDPLPYMDASDLIVSMGGYNTVSEILALGKKAIVVPRVRPRAEQLIRSRRLQDLGLLRMIHPEELTPERLASEITAGFHTPPQPAPTPLDFTAFDKLGEMMKLFTSSSVGLQLVPGGAGQ